MNAAIAIAIDKTCAMGPLRRPYAGGEHDELGLVHRVADQALLLEPVQRIPIKPLPGPPVVMAGQKEERQHRFVDLVRVESHPPTLPVSLDLRWRSWLYVRQCGRLHVQTPSVSETTRNGTVLAQRP